MARLFIQHDGAGNILAVARVESMAGDLPHPFLLKEASQGVLEVAENDPAAQGEPHEIQESCRVDVAGGRLIRK